MTSGLEVKIQGHQKSQIGAFQSFPIALQEMQPPPFPPSISKPFSVASLDHPGSLPAATPLLSPCPAGARAGFLAIMPPPPSGSSSFPAAERLRRLSRHCQGLRPEGNLSDYHCSSSEDYPTAAHVLTVGLKRHLHPLHSLSP